MNKLYLVVKYYGTNSNSYDSLIGIFKDKNNAEKYKYEYYNENKIDCIIKEIVTDIDFNNLINNKKKYPFRCDTCKHPSHAGVWGKPYPKPCFWCKGEYVYPGSKIASECEDYEPITDAWYGDTRPVLA